MTVGQLRSRLGRRRDGAHHGDSGNGLELVDGGHYGVVQGVGLAIEIGELGAASSADQGIVAASLEHVIDDFVRLEIGPSTIRVKVWVVMPKCRLLLL